MSWSKLRAALVAHSVCRFWRALPRPPRGGEPRWSGADDSKLVLALHNPAFRDGGGRPRWVDIQKELFPDKTAASLRHRLARMNAPRGRNKCKSCGQRAKGHTCPMRV